MNKPHYILDKTGVLIEKKPFQSLNHLGLPSFETFIVEAMLNHWRGRTNVRQVQIALGTLELSEEQIHKAFRALETLGLVVIREPLFTDWMPAGWWTITFPGWLNRSCECCGALGGFYPPWPPATFKPPAAPKPTPQRKRGRPARVIPASSTL